MLGKVSTFFQIVLVLLVLLEAAFPYPLFRWLGYLALLLAAIFTCLSGLRLCSPGMPWHAKGLTAAEAGSSLKTWSRVLKYSCRRVCTRALAGPRC